VGLACQALGYSVGMDSPRHPVLHYLAVVRAARDFGLDPVDVDPLALRCSPVAERLAEAVSAKLLERG
jgi:hypothetical protein